LDALPQRFILGRFVQEIDDMQAIAAGHNEGGREVHFMDHFQGVLLGHILREVEIDIAGSELGNSLLILALTDAGVHAKEEFSAVPILRIGPVNGGFEPVIDETVTGRRGDHEEGATWLHLVGTNPLECSYLPEARMRSHQP
jgi:hypothetical protein